jgi:amino-acid N-acetyltransferase
MNAVIERAVATDLDETLELLREVDLPIEGVTEHFSEFFVARDDGKLTGCVGLERCGNAALLRSLAVSPSLQRSGLGRSLTKRLLDSAYSSGVNDVVLLTTTAADFFSRHFGFASVERKQFDDLFADSIEWRLPRCSSAVCMHLRLS